MTPAARRLATLLAFAAAMTRRDVTRARRALLAARRAGVGRREAEETALMLMLHAGYPAALEGVRVLAEAWPGRATRTREGGVVSWTRRGEALCRRVYGPVYPKLVASVRALHPDLAVWMIEQGYGRVLSRRPLSGAARELVAVTVLAAGGWERQLVSHLKGAVRLGAPRAAARLALRRAVAHAPADVRAAAGRAWSAAFAGDPAAGRPRAARARASAAR